MFLEILQNSQESTCARVSFFNKAAGLKGTEHFWTTVSRMRPVAWNAKAATRDVL